MYGEEVVHAEGWGEGVVDGHVGEFQVFDVGVLIELQLHFEVGPRVPVYYDEYLDQVRWNLVAQVGYPQGGHLQVGVDYGGCVGDSHVLTSCGSMDRGECDGAWVREEVPDLK